jgi:ERCC4-type nuclease
MIDYNNFHIIVDTREQQPWSFDHHITASEKLDTGDYSVRGIENILCVERKKSVGEVATNITEKRFKDVVGRMSQFKYAFLLLEFSMDQLLSYPVGSNVPRRMWDKIKISPNFILKHLVELQVFFNIKVLFCGSASNGEKMALSIMKKVYEIEGQSTKENI